MNATHRVTGLFFGALLLVAFFLPWIEGNVAIISITITGYDLLMGTSKVKGYVGREFDPQTYFILLFPITGFISIVFNGLLNIPYVSLFAAMGTIAFTVYRITDFGWKNVQSGSGAIGLGLWISFFCVLAVFVNSVLQATTGRKKK